MEIDVSEYNPIWIDEKHLSLATYYVTKLSLHWIRWWMDRCQHHAKHNTNDFYLAYKNRNKDVLKCIVRNVTTILVSVQMSSWLYLDHHWWQSSNVGNIQLTFIHVVQLSRFIHYSDRLLWDVSIQLTHCGLMMPDYIMGVGHSGLRWWLVARQHQSITWTNAGLVCCKLYP